MYVNDEAHENSAKFNINLKVYPENERMSSFMYNKISEYLKHFKFKHKILVKVNLSNKKITDVQFLDSTVGRIKDRYIAEVELINCDNFETITKTKFENNTSKNYTSTKTQVMQATYGNIDESILEDLSYKIFNYIKVSID